MALLPQHDAPRVTFGPIYPIVPLTTEEKRRLETDRRLVDGEHCEYLDQSERNRLVLLDWLLENKRHGYG